KTVVGLEIRDSNEKKMALGSEVVDSFWVSNYSKTHKTLVVSENPIDNLSYCQLNRNFSCTHIASLGTISDKQCHKIAQLINRGIYKSLKLINDNDFAGYKNDLKIISKFIPQDKLRIVSQEVKSIIIEIENEQIDISNINIFKWILGKIIQNNDLGNKINIEKSASKDWNNEL
ncbi:toprim domain-containing protein, partial [Plebeiibacterium sediminum]